MINAFAASTLKAFSTGIARKPISSWRNCEGGIEMSVV